MSSVVLAVGQPSYSRDALVSGYTQMVSIYAVMRQVPYFSSVEASAIRIN